jgi:hypothetical protein
LTNVSTYSEPHNKSNHVKGNVPGWGFSNANSRFITAQHARLECGDDDAALHPSAVPPLDHDTLVGVPVAGDEDIVYSFDAKASPASSLGLDNLVDAAEKHFKTRELEKIVKDEYEVLDEAGEPLQGRKLKKAGSKLAGEPVPVSSVKIVDEDIDGDWETI